MLVSVQGYREAVESMNKMAKIYGLVTNNAQRRKERWAYAMMKVREDPELTLDLFPLHGRKVKAAP